MRPDAKTFALAKTGYGTVQGRSCIIISVLVGGNTLQQADVLSAFQQCTGAVLHAHSNTWWAGRAKVNCLAKRSRAVRNQLGELLPTGVQGELEAGLVAAAGMGL